MNELKPETWVDTYTDYLFSLAFLKTSSREDAEDLVQETFLSAFKGKDGFRGDSTEKTWLTAILKHKLIDYYRKKNVDQPLADYISNTSNSFRESVFDEGNYGRFKELIRPNYFSKSGEDYLISEEFSKILEDCIMKMPTRLRSIFVAKYMEDEESDDICKEHGISSSNYWVVIHRSKIVLRACLERQGIQ